MLSGCRRARRRPRRRDTTISGRPWRFLIGGGVLCVVVCALAIWLLGRAQEEQQSRQTQRDLLTQARLLRDVIRASEAHAQSHAVSELVQTLTAAGVQVALLGPDGTGGPDRTSDFQETPEVRQAIRPGGEWGADTRPWGHEGRPHIMVAVRVRTDDDVPLAVVWLARPRWTLTADPVAAAQVIGVVAATVAALLLALFFLNIRLRRRVLKHAIRAIRTLSAGDLSAHLAVGDDSAFTGVTAALNTLRRRLTGQLKVIDRQRHMLQALVDHLQEGVIVTGSDGRIALINPPAIQMLDLKPGPGGKLVGVPLENVIPHHPLQQLLSPREAAAPEPDVEIRLAVESPAGTAHLVARGTQVTLAEPNADAGAAPVGRVALLSNVTEVQRLLQMRTDFVANASHELRTPLSTIRAAVETLLAMDLATEGPAARSFLEKIDRHSERLQLMVADLLDLSRLETPTERFEPEALDCKRWLQDLESRFAEALERKSLHWQATRVPPDARTMLANPHLLRLAIDNLVDNAIKFTEPGGHVNLELRVAGDEAVFRVTDDGCGIPPEDQQRVFERFYQVQRARSGPQRGTGLGLSIVRHAVGALRGRVQLESRPGAGTQVTVTIPQDAA